MNAKENALRIIRFDGPERVVCECPTHMIAYRGANHEGYTKGGHHLPVGATWVDILNPAQATANDLDEVRRRTQGRMALQGGVRSATIVAGPVEAIRGEAAQRLWQLGREGGYFCGPDQGMPWPEEHIQALHRAVDELGRYPLDPDLLDLEGL